MTKSEEKKLSKKGRVGNLGQREIILRERGKGKVERSVLRRLEDRMMIYLVKKFNL